jgi:hypothetical protein
MRKHPLIALIAFAFLAISTFVGAAGAGSINSIPARATSHLSHGAGGSASPRVNSLRWLATTARERAATASQFSIVPASERSSKFWQGRAADLVAIHDGSRPVNGLLPSRWRAIQLHAAQRAAARAAAARALLAAQKEAAQTAQQQAAEEQAAETQTTAPPPVTTTTQASIVATTTTTTTVPPTTTTVPPTTTPPPSGGDLGGVWLQLRICESGNNYGENTGNGYYGAYQFALSTWESIGYSGLPSNAPPAVQDQAAEKLQAMEGWSPWPACSAELGL